MDSGFCSITQQKYCFFCRALDRTASPVADKEKEKKSTRGRERERKRRGSGSSSSSGR